MPIRISKLKLIDYCGYRDVTFDFMSNGNIMPISVFYGPNGSGKSSALQAINLLSNTKMFSNRNADLFFRRLVYNNDYNPIMGKYEYELQKQKAIKNNEELICKYNMKIEATFLDEENNEKVIILTDKNGIELDELKKQKHIVLIDADHPLNMQRFQIEESRVDKFMNLATHLYGFDVEMVTNSKVSTQSANEKIIFFQDFTIKKRDTTIHYKSMSDGEKKIATLLRQLCSETVKNCDIILIDNIEMHIYFKRHNILIDKLLEIFNNKQFLVTSHSQTLIDHVSNKYGKIFTFDIEKYFTNV